MTEDSGRARVPYAFDPDTGGFLYSDGMSGGTSCVFVPPWDVYPRPRGRARSRGFSRPRRG